MLPIPIYVRLKQVWVGGKIWGNTCCSYHFVKQNTMYSLKLKNKTKQSQKHKLVGSIYHKIKFCEWVCTPWNQCPHLPDRSRKLIPRQPLASIIPVVTWVHTLQMGTKFGVNSCSWISTTFHQSRPIAQSGNVPNLA